MKKSGSYTRATTVVVSSGRWSAESRVRDSQVRSYKRQTSRKFLLVQGRLIIDISSTYKVQRDFSLNNFENLSIKIYLTEFTEGIGKRRKSWNAAGGARGGPVTASEYSEKHNALIHHETWFPPLYSFTCRTRETVEIEPSFLIDGRDLHYVIASKAERDQLLKSPQSSPKINHMLITSLICMRWKSSRFLCLRAQPS